MRPRIPFAPAALRLFLALLLAAAVCPARAFAFGKNKVAYEQFDWHIYRSPHFDVYYYPEEESLLQQVVSDAESQYMRLSQILDHEIKFRIPLIYYRTHVEFEQTNVILEFIPEAPVPDVRYVRIVTRSSPSWISWREIEIIAP